MSVCGCVGVLVLIMEQREEAVRGNYVLSFSHGHGGVSADTVKYWCRINSRLIREAELIRKELIRLFFSVK